MVHEHCHVYNNSSIILQMVKLNFNFLLDSSLFQLGFSTPSFDSLRINWSNEAERIICYIPKNELIEVQFKTAKTIFKEKKKIWKARKTINIKAVSKSFFLPYSTVASPITTLSYKASLSLKRNKIVKLQNTK